MLGPVRKVKKRENRLSVNPQNLLYTIFCESTVLEGVIYYSCLITGFGAFWIVTVLFVRTYSHVVSALNIALINTWFSGICKDWFKFSGYERNVLFVGQTYRENVTFISYPLIFRQPS